MAETRNSIPTISGLSPKEGMPGTTITIRGENLGTDPSDLVALIICGTDCLATAQWKSSSKIIARLGLAKRGLGDIVIVTKSGGRSVSNLQFRVFIEQVGPLAESSVWVDESRTVPCRSIVRNVADVGETARDALGLNPNNEQPKVGYNELIKLFPDTSGNLRMNNFNPAWYLLENHKETSFNDLQKGIVYLRKEIAKERQSSNDVHKSNLYSLISCVDALNNLHMLIESDCADYTWPLTAPATKLVGTAKRTADNLFSDVLSRKDRADSTRNALSVLTRFRFIFFLTGVIDENMQKNDYATILNDYTRAKALYKDSDVSLFKQVMDELEIKIANFKELLKQKLIDTPASFEEQSRLIKYLKILDQDSNPAWDCIMAYHCWLENVLWELQNRYCKLAEEEEVNGQLEFVNFDGGSNNYVQTFITEMLSMLTDKLSTFWKLAQSYSDASDEKYMEQQDDINQMVSNTINVGSWLMLNALIPNSLPEQIIEQYKKEFVVWPKSSQREKGIQLNHLFFALKSLRATIKTLLESQFSRTHVQTLIELSKTIRLKSIELLTTKSGEAILSLASQENWNIDVDVKSSKTILPDLYETELNEILPHFNQLLSTNGYPGEEDLFAKENIRQLIVDQFIRVICSIRDCYEQLLQLKSKRRPNRLMLDSSDVASNTSSNEDNAERNRSPELTSRRLLICICNIEYVLQHSLPMICKRMAESIKYANLILEKSKQELLSFRRDLINKYLLMKTSPLSTLVEAASYEHPPESDDVSSFLKELIMGIVFIKAELHLLLPQLTLQILTSAVETSIHKLLLFIANVEITSNDLATQIVVDLTAIEEALRPFTSVQLQHKTNAIRARLISRLDNTLFQSSIKHFRQSMKLALESLTVSEADSNDLDSSDV